VTETTGNRPWHWNVVDKLPMWGITSTSTLVAVTLFVGKRKEQTGLDKGFQDISRKVNNRASRFVYTG